MALRPRGPNVVRTARATLAVPAISFSRAVSSNVSSFAMLAPPLAARRSRVKSSRSQVASSSTVPISLAGIDRSPSPRKQRAIWLQRGSHNYI